MRIVYDASSRATPNSPSLNDCLYPGPVLQNKLWDILIQQRGYAVILAGDIRKAFYRSGSTKANGTLFVFIDELTPNQRLKPIALQEYYLVSPHRHSS